MLVYKSPTGKQIVFDDYEDERKEYGVFWAPMCPHCHNKYRGLLKAKGITVSAGGSNEMTCGVYGCNSAIGGYYVDFVANIVKESEVA